MIACSSKEKKVAPEQPILKAGEPKPVKNERVCVTALDATILTDLNQLKTTEANRYYRVDFLLPNTHQEKKSIGRFVTVAVHGFSRTKEKPARAVFLEKGQTVLGVLPEIASFLDKNNLCARANPNSFDWRSLSYFVMPMSFLEKSGELAIEFTEGGESLVLDVFPKKNLKPIIKALTPTLDKRSEPDIAAVNDLIFSYHCAGVIDQKDTCQSAKLNK